MEADLQDTEDGSKNTCEANGSGAGVEVVCLALLGGAAAAGAGRCAADVAGCGLAACADEFALDDIVWTSLGLESSTVGGKIGGGLNVEGAMVVLESWERNAVYLVSGCRT